MGKHHLVSVALVLLFLCSAVPPNVAALEDTSSWFDVSTYPDGSFFYGSTYNI
jgi:hypothetical protein